MNFDLFNNLHVEYRGFLNPTFEDGMYRESITV